MKKEKIVLTVLLCAFIFAFIGCSTLKRIYGIDYSVENQYPERWEKTKVGMTLEEFKTVWTDVKFKEDTPTGGEVYVFWETNGNNLTELFYFEKNKLTKWRESVAAL
ncbi:MAG: hypothetical protein Ta2B_05410 [Termitinemataceae bacterium]|nr:MAG: hypothetical protein Ta2B_05410 [Termitinemataceae bacterium]